MRIKSLKRQFKLPKLAALFALIVLMVGSAVATPLVRADTLQEQINKLQADNNQKIQQNQSLEIQANGLEATIGLLKSQIDTIESRIEKNNKKNDKLQKDIAAAQKELDHQRALLGESIKAMYLEGEISTIELLATSDSLSDYFDKQQYRDVVKSKVKTSLDNVTALKAQLKDQQDELKKLIAEQKELRADLSQQKAEQDRLLNLNQGEQSKLDTQMRANYAKISDLRRQQAIANAQLGGAGLIAGDPGHGGYPALYNNRPQDSMIDAWGMYNRECVSYTAWRVYSTFGHMPYWGGRGNANQWPANARAAGIPTGSTPRVNSVAVWNVGYYGHVMWVEAVNNDGSIWISQYNYDYNGHYSEMRVSASMAASLTYIYFN